MKQIRVVIAEDDQQIAEIQRRFLARIEGFELVGIAYSLEEARDLVEVLQPELVLLDIQFPTGTGLELLREIRARNSAVDVILITAAKEVETLQAALRGGVFDYILKPLVFERLQEALTRYQTHLAKFQALHLIAQSDVDRMLPREQGGSGGQQRDNRLPKGIDGLTLDKVRQTFESPVQTFNAEEVGARIGASRTTARRYLEYLVSTGELSAEVSYGCVGRPERRYSAASLRSP